MTAGRCVPMDQLVEWARQVQFDHALGAEADAGFDGGEFSGPAHDRMEERELTALAELHGYTYDELMSALMAGELMSEDEAAGYGDSMGPRP